MSVPGSVERYREVAPNVERYLRRKQRAAVRRDASREEPTTDVGKRAERFASYTPGDPLGRGMPGGRTFRLDGESHSDAWRRLLRLDVCAYCGGPGGTVDHVVPRASGLAGVESWVNLVGACVSCNTSKRDLDLLGFLARRYASLPRVRRSVA